MDAFATLKSRLFHPCRSAFGYLLLNGASHLLRRQFVFQKASLKLSKLPHFHLPLALDGEFYIYSIAKWLRWYYLGILNFTIENQSLLMYILRIEIISPEFISFLKCQIFRSKLIFNSSMRMQLISLS